MADTTEPFSGQSSRAVPPSPALDLPGYERPVEIGRGGFGIVYRARQVEFERTVAIKLVTSAFDERARTRFERERRAVGSLSGHPNIVTVYASGITSDGRPFIVMEYLAGGSLADRLTRGPLPWPEAVAIGVKLASAVEAAHAAGLLHRDIKPENVLMSAYDEPKLADFGIARLEGAALTTSGVVIATIAYAAPEILDGKPATAASDVYSLGATIHALVAGRPAFVHESDETLLPVYARIASGPVPDLRTQGLPDGVCVVLEQAMKKDPAQRPGSAAELRARLQEAALARDTGEPAPASAASARRRRVPVRLRVALAIVAALAIGAVSFAVTRASDTESNAGGRITIAVGSNPSGVAVGAGAVWVTNNNYTDGTLSRIDPATNSVSTTIDIGDRPGAVVVGEGAVWVSQPIEDVVSRIDPATNAVTERIPQGGGDLAVGAGAVWTTSSSGTSGTVLRIDPATNSVTGQIDVGTPPLGDIVVVAGAVWVASSLDGTLSRIDPPTVMLIAPVDLGDGLGVEDMAVGEGAVWLARSNGTVSRVDPATNSVTATIDIGDGSEARVSGVAIGAGAVWVTDSADNTVSRIDPSTNSVTRTNEVGRDPRGIAVGSGSVWVANYADATVSRIRT